MAPLFTVSTLTRVEVAAIPTVLITDLKPMNRLELFPPILRVLAGIGNWVYYPAMPRDIVLPSHRALSVMAHNHSDF